ncbi:MAG: hypothetical protein KME21_02805 [Desmonostoc vinosum HA7617-LM4]|nr:hypothetical protein [Desmonostoc vinosum HA7617-LM4]
MGNGELSFVICHLLLIILRVLCVPPSPRLNPQSPVPSPQSPIPSPQSL